MNLRIGQHWRTAVQRETTFPWPSTCTREHPKKIRIFFKLISLYISPLPQYPRFTSFFRVEHIRTVRPRLFPPPWSESFPSCWSNKKVRFGYGTASHIRYTYLYVSPLILTHHASLSYSPCNFNSRLRRLRRVEATTDRLCLRIPTPQIQR